MSETVIRSMTSEDLDAVTAIEAETFAIPWSRESFRQELERNVAARYLVAEKEGRVLVTTYLFNNDSRRIHDRVPIGEVPAMTREDYRPGGCTALMDAVGDAIRHIAGIHRYARKEDVPGRTLFVIITDGMENASHR